MNSSYNFSFVNLQENSITIAWPIFVAVLAAAIIIPTVVVLVNRHRTKRIYSSISEMLDRAIKDEVVDERFDENQISALETKFANYLSAATVTSNSIKEEKDKIKSLIADISHQTKTPIANLLLYCELMQEEELPQSAKGYVDSIHGQAEKLSFLIDSLVKLSRLENGILALEPVAGNLEPLFEKVHSDYLMKAQAKGLELIVKNTDCNAVYDAKWTSEALGNLIDNAIKYTEKGSITVSASAYDMFTRIDVADTGIGISEDETSKIFSRFYRSSSGREQDGVGIGLFLARKIVSSEGGYIKVSSKAGEGSVFSIFLRNK